MRAGGLMPLFESAVFRRFLYESLAAYAARLSLVVGARAVWPMPLE